MVALATTMLVCLMVGMCKRPAWLASGTCCLHMWNLNQGLPRASSIIS